MPSTRLNQPSLAMSGYERQSTISGPERILANHKPDGLEGRARRGCSSPTTNLRAYFLLSQSTHQLSQSFHLSSSSLGAVVQFARQIACIVGAQNLVRRIVVHRPQYTVAVAVGRDGERSSAVRIADRGL